MRDSQLEPIRYGNSAVALRSGLESVMKMLRKSADELVILSPARGARIRAAGLLAFGLVLLPFGLLMVAGRLYKLVWAPL